MSTMNAQEDTTLDVYFKVFRNSFFFLDHFLLFKLEKKNQNSIFS